MENPLPNGGGKSPRRMKSSLFNAATQVTMESGGMYPEGEIFQSWRLTRSWVDKSSFSNAGNGIPSKKSRRNHGADAPKNESGRTGADLSWDRRSRPVSSGNGFFIAPNCFRSEFGTPQMSILHMRSCCSSAVKRLDTPRTSEVSEYAYMRIGSAGQIFSISSIGLLFVQNSRRFKRRGEENTTDRHLRHT